MMQMQQQPPNLPFGFGVNGHQDGTIANLRWKDNETINYVEEILGGYKEILQPDGTVIKMRPDYFKPKINDDGLTSVVSFLKSHINPQIALSNFSDGYGMVLIKQQLDSFACHLALNQDRFGIPKGDMGLIMSLVRPIIFAQIMRAVDGHESANFRTQSLEHNVQQNTTMSNNQGGLSWWPKRR